MMTVLFLNGTILKYFFVGSAWAQTIPFPPDIACTNLYGCGGGTANVIAKNAPIVLMWMVNIAAAIALSMIIWSGYTMLASLGDESKISKGRWGVLYSLLGLVLVISAQVIVGSIGTVNFGQDASPMLIVANLFAAFVTSARLILNIAFTIVMVVAGIRMVYAQGKSEEFTKGKTMITGAIFGAIVINLAPNLIRALVAIF